MAELPNGTLAMNSRNFVDYKPTRTGVGPVGRAISYSHDQGESFTFSHIAHDLPDPVVEGSMISAGDGTDRLVFSNPSSDMTRVNMSIHVSDDAGESWAQPQARPESPSL